ncbi:phosducin-like protein [Watersipora subatra]|uniref:phosducin-like protein n=1 Tax=Watersipora subatra TaxID=2589382 RepID=UPI00355ACDB7
MAGTLSTDDVLLGEKMHYYCSSSEDEYEDAEEGDFVDESVSVPVPPQHSISGTSRNTGPKGVISDWQRLKQLEAEKRLEQEQELLALQKKLSITCRSHLDDQKAEEEDEELLKQLESMDDEFTKEYQRKRMEEIRSLIAGVPRFGTIQDLETAVEFHDVTEDAHPLTTVIIYVYEENSLACVAMEGCLQYMCKQHLSIKFCRILAHKASLSTKFSEEGVPALLVYQKGVLVRNLVALHTVLGDDFFVGDVESLLKISELVHPELDSPGLVQS